MNGEQVTIQFHVDYLKISHKDQNVLDSILTNLNNKFGTKKKQLSVTRGTVHDYLGITIDYSESEKVKFIMIDYLRDIVDDMPVDMKGGARTTVRSNVFEVDTESPLLSQKRADFFHRISARLLFAAKRARPEIQVAVAFLCTRMKAPNESEYLKLVRVIQYLQATVFIPLVLGWDGSGKLLWWSVDASFVVHKDKIK